MQENEYHKAEESDNFLDMLDGADGDVTCQCRLHGSMS